MELFDPQRSHWLKTDSVSKMVAIPEPGKGLRRRSAAIYGWDRPLLTLVYPGFDCGSVSFFVFFLFGGSDSQKQVFCAFN